MFANRSQAALFRWKYVLDGADQKSLKIKCGYLTNVQGLSQITVLASKRGHNSAMTAGGRLPGNINQQVESYEEIVEGGVDRSVVGFKIPYAQLSHPRQYACNSIFRISMDDLNDKISETKNLVVLGNNLILYLLKC